MAKYRVPDVDMSTRIDLALALIPSIPQRAWGAVSELSRQYQLSRTTLYKLRDTALAALHQALAPHEPGRPPIATSLVVDKALIDRMIAVWPMVLPTVRGIQDGLDLILGVHRSVGYISQTLRQAGEKAAAHNAQEVPTQPVLAEADEIFQGRQPCLTVIDGRSFLILNLTPAEARDGTTWGLTFLDLQARGVQFLDLATDGGSGLLAGVDAAQLAVPLRPDLFHLLQEAHRISRHLERIAYRAIETADHARRALQEAQASQRRRGRPLKVKVPLAQAEAEEAQAVNQCFLWTWLMGEVRQALEPITPTGCVTTTAHVRTTLETAIELLMDLNQPTITAFAQTLRKHLTQLIAPLAWLEQQLAPWRSGLDPATEAFVVWAAQHRSHLAIEQDIPPHLQAVVRACADALALFHRSSSLVESLHSWLRPHWQAHRGMPQWLSPLLQLFWNHHEFERGKRAGDSPLRRAGVEEAPSLRDILDHLFGPQPSAQPA